MATLKNGVKQARGGYRPNAGRKPNAITILHRQFIADRGEQAQYAMDLHISAMKDDTLPAQLRMAAADWVYIQVVGKAVERKAEVNPEFTKWLDDVRKLVLGTESGSKVGEDEHPTPQVVRQSGGESKLRDS